MRTIERHLERPPAERLLRKEFSVRRAGPAVKRTLRLAGLSAASIIVALAGLISPGSTWAQTISQTIEPEGWTRDGEHFAIDVEISGRLATSPTESPSTDVAPATASVETAPEGSGATPPPGSGHARAAPTASTPAAPESEAFTYRLLRIMRVADGAIAGTFRAGRPEGPQQAIYRSAAPAVEGRSLLDRTGLLRAHTASMSPDRDRAIVTVYRTARVPVDPECATCRRCRTTYSVLLFDEASEQAVLLDQGNRRGPMVRAPEQPDCVQVSTEPWWHPAGDRVGVVLREEAPGHRYDSAYLFDFREGFGAFNAVGIAAPPRALQLGSIMPALRARIAALRDAANRNAEMLTIARRALEGGALTLAEEYLHVLREVADSGEVSFLSAILEALRGSRDALGAARRAARNARELDTDRWLAVAHYLRGDERRALQYTGGALTTDLARDALRYDLEAGIRALDALHAADALDVTGARLLVSAYLEQGRVADAAHIAATLEPHDPVNIGILLRVLYAQELADADDVTDTEDAAEVAEEIDLAQRSWEQLADHHGICQAYTTLGHAERDASAAKRSIVAYRAAHACDRDDVYALRALGVALWQDGQIDEAARALEQFVRTAGERANDPVRSLLRERARSRIERARGGNLLVLDHDCRAEGDALRCSGTLLHRGDALIPDAVARLQVRADGEIAREAAGVVGAVGPGDRARFEVEFPDWGGGEAGETWLVLHGEDPTDIQDRLRIERPSQVESD